MKRDEKAMFDQVKSNSGKPHCSSVSPVRVSQFLFNVDKMKEQANTAASVNQHQYDKAKTVDQKILSHM